VMDERVSGSVTRTYAYGLQRISENQLVSSTWTPSFYGYDGHGNARFLANAAGTITDTYTFDAFGAPIASTGTTPNPYLYSGERFDSALNLYHLRARYYNALTGRFMTMDPMHGKSCCRSASCLSSNSYAYASDDPVDRLDPTGRADFLEYVSGLVSRLRAHIFALRIGKVGVCALILADDLAACSRLPSGIAEECVFEANVNYVECLNSGP
jgi:RHS repeat-associated protein